MACANDDKATKAPAMTTFTIANEHPQGVPDNLNKHALNQKEERRDNDDDNDNGGNTPRDNTVTTQITTFVLTMAVAAIRVATTCNNSSNHGNDHSINRNTTETNIHGWKRSSQDELRIGLPTESNRNRYILIELESSSKSSKRIESRTRSAVFVLAGC